MLLCQGAAELLNLCDGSLVPGTKALHSKWQEHDSLVVAGLPRFVHFAPVSNLQGMARCLSSLGDSGCLQGVDHRHVESRVLSTRMTRDKNIRWLPTLTWHLV